MTDGSRNTDNAVAGIIADAEEAYRHEMIRRLLEAIGRKPDEKIKEITALGFLAEVFEALDGEHFDVECLLDQFQS